MVIDEQKINDAEYILNIAKNGDSHISVSIFSKVGPKLVSDIDFLRKFFELYTDRGAKLDFDRLFQHIPIRIYENNEEFWDMMEEIGYGWLIEYKYVGNNPERMKQRINRTPNFGVELLPSKLANDEEFILEILKTNSNLRPLCAFRNVGESLRSDFEFIKKFFEVFKGKELNIKAFMQYMPEETYMYNDEFWQHLENCGIVTSKAKYGEYRYSSNEEKEKALEEEKRKKLIASNWNGVINIKTGTIYDEEGYDVYGYNEKGCNKAGFYENGFHSITGTRYNLDGIDEFGYDEEGYKYSSTFHCMIDRHGFGENGWCVYTNDFKDSRGKTKIEYDYGVKRFLDLLQIGWEKDGTYKATGTKYDQEGYDIYGYDADGYDRQGYDANGYHKVHLFNRKGIHKITRKTTDRNGRTLAECKKIQEQLEKERIAEEYNRAGENHPNILLVNEYLESKVIQKAFCAKKGISEEEFSRILEEVSLVYPEYQERLKNKLKQSSAVFLNRTSKIIEQLLSGEMTLVEYSREKEGRYKLYVLTSRIQDTEQRKNFATLVLNQIVSGNLTMMDYFRLFSEEYDAQKVITSVTSFVKAVSEEFPELEGKGKPVNIAKIKLKGLQKFTKQYKTADLIGMKISQNGKTAFITEEHINIAREYLRAVDEYICHVTMYDAVRKVALGIIPQEEIDRKIELYKLRKKSLEVRGLREKEEETRMIMETAGELESEYEVAYEEQMNTTANQSDIPDAPAGEGR